MLCSRSVKERSNQLPKVDRVARVCCMSSPPLLPTRSPHIFQAHSQWRKSPTAGPRDTSSSVWGRIWGTARVAGWPLLPGPVGENRWRSGTLCSTRKQGGQGAGGAMLYIWSPPPDQVSCFQILDATPPPSFCTIGPACTWKAVRIDPLISGRVQNPLWSVSRNRKNRFDSLGRLAGAATS